MNINIYDNWYLSIAISHMKDKSCIDEKCLYVTFHIENENDFEKINYEIHNYLKNIVKINKLPLGRQPSIISSLDFESSKNGFFSSKAPHIHMLVFFAERSGEAVLTEYEVKIVEFLKNSPGISQKGTSPIQVTKFDNRGYKPLNEQLLNVLNYNRKSRLGDDRKVMVLPYYDIMASNKNDLLKDRLEKSAGIVRTNLNDPSKHHFYYSKAV